MNDILIKIDTATAKAYCENNRIGVQHANLQNKLIFEMSEKINGSAWLEYEINGTKNYAEMEDTENGYQIDIKSCLLVSNNVNVDLKITESEDAEGIPIFISTIVELDVDESINATEEEPEYYPDWKTVADSKIAEMNQLKEEIEAAIEETNNLDLDISKEGKIATVTLTKKDATTKFITLSDGTNLMFNWDGTRLGIKTDEDEEYTYVDLIGPQGIQGETGTTPNLTIGTVITGNTSSATITGTPENPVLNLVLEKGDTGETGATGNGIASYEKTSTSGLVDIYTLTFTNGNSVNVEVTNGRGIVDILKTSTSGNIDTYTITYNDNTTSTFTVTNSTVTNQEFEELKAEHEELVNTLPRVEGTGESITLDNTAQYKMNVALNPSELSQTTYTGKNLFNFNDTYYNRYSTYTSITVQNNTITIANTNANNAGYLWWNIYVEANKDYTISYKDLVETTVVSNDTMFYAVSDTQITDYNSLSGNFTTINKTNKYVTINNTNQYIIVGLRVAPNTTYTISEIQLEQSSTATSYEPYVGGVPSPNPLYPQSIKKVTGNNSITVFGKNLFGSHCNLLYKNTGTWTNDGTSVTGSTTSGGYALYDLGLLSDYVGKTLTFSFSNTPSTIYGLTAFVMCENDGSNRETVSGSTLGTNSSLTVTIPSGYTQTRLAIRLYLSNVSSSTFNNIQIEKNSTATSYEPYQSQTYPINLGSLEYCKIGDYSDSFLLTTGKNLFMSEYVYTPSQTKNANLAAGTYTFSMCDGNVFGANIYFKLYDSNDNIITTDGHLTSSRSLSFSTTSYAYYGAAGWSSITFTIDSGYKLNIGVLGADGTRRAMLVTGDTIVRDYEPYGSGTWYIEKNIGEVILDGTETGWKNDSQNKLCGLPINDILSITAPSITTAICDRFQATTLQNSRTDNIYFSQNSTDIWFNNQNLTLDNFKAWIGTNNTTVYYPLATPTYTQITDTTLVAQLNNLYTNISSYLGQTNITQTNADLPFVINASALYDLNNLISRVATLEVGV